MDEMIRLGVKRSSEFKTCQIQQLRYLFRRQTTLLTLTFVCATDYDNKNNTRDSQSVAQHKLLVPVITRRQNRDCQVPKDVTYGQQHTHSSIHKDVARHGLARRDLFTGIYRQPPPNEFFKIDHPALVYDRGVSSCSSLGWPAEWPHLNWGGKNSG